MKNLFSYFFAQSIFLSSPLQISYYFALPIAQICSIPHSKSFSLFFLSLTHCPYFLSFPLQISYYFALPIAQICSITHSKSLSFFFFLFFFLSLTHCPYFLSFPLQLSYFFSLLPTTQKQQIQTLLNIQT